MLVEIDESTAVFEAKDTAYGRDHIVKDDGQENIPNR